jgi:hypothetical protein
VVRLASLRAAMKLSNRSFAAAASSGWRSARLRSRRRKNAGRFTRAAGRFSPPGNPSSSFCVVARWVQKSSSRAGCRDSTSRGRRSRSSIGSQTMSQFDFKLRGARPSSSPEIPPRPGVRSAVRAPILGDMRAQPIRSSSSSRLLPRCISATTCWCPSRSLSF